MQVASAINCLVHTMRLPDGSRKVVDISEVLPLENGDYKTSKLMEWKTKSISPDGTVCGAFRLCNRLSFEGEAQIMGIELPQYS